MKSRVDVLYLFHGEGHGGDAKVVLRLAVMMRDRGLAVRCAIANSQPHADKFVCEARERNISCDLLNYFGSSSRLKRWGALAWYLRKVRARVLHLHTGDAFIHRPMALAAWAGHRGRRLATLHWLRSPIHTSQRHIREQEFSERFFHAIIVPTEYARHLYRAHALSRSKVPVYAVGNPVSPLLPSQNARQLIREELGIQPQATVLLFASLLNDRKRPLDAIKVFKHLALQRKGLILLIAGTGDQEADCRAAAADLRDRIKFLGYRHDIDDVMRASDVHLLPSMGESFGLSVLDAMANGIASVCYRLEPLIEVVGITGLQFLAEDIDQLRNKLELAVDHPALRADVQLDGLRRVSVLFNDDVARAHLGLYDHSIAKGRLVSTPEPASKHSSDVSITIVIPAYRHAHLITETIQSALNQQYDDLEIIVIDDGSPDNTSEVVAGFADKRVRYVRQENKGQAAARNLGIRLSTSPYIKFLDDDDILTPGAIIQQIEYLENHPACAGVAGDVIEFWPDGSEIYRKAQDFSWKNVLSECPVLSPGAITFRREALLSVGCLDSRFPGVDDHDLYLRLARATDIPLMPGTVLKYRRHSSNASLSMKMFAQERKLLRYHLKCGGWPSSIRARMIVGRMLYKYWGRPAIRSIRDGILRARPKEAYDGVSETIRIFDFILFDPLLWYRVVVDLLPDTIRNGCLQILRAVSQQTTLHLGLFKFRKAG